MSAPTVDAAGVCHDFQVTVPKGSVVDDKAIHTNRKVTLVPFNITDDRVAWKGEKGKLRTVSVRAVQFPHEARRALFYRGAA